MNNIEKKARDISKGLAIPTDELSFKKYQDASSADVLQVYFRQKRPPKEKYGFEIRVGSIPASIIEDKMRRLLKDMECAYLENCGKVTFYNGQAFMWETVYKQGDNEYWKSFGHDMDAGYIEIACASCGWEERSEEVPFDTFQQIQDALLVWSLARAGGKCDCDAFEPVHDNLSTDVDIDSVHVKEGEQFPRLS